MNGRPRSAAELRSRVLSAVRQEPVAARPSESRRRSLWIALGFAGTGGVFVLRSVLDRAVGATSTIAQGEPLWHVIPAGGGVEPHHHLAYIVTVELVWGLVALGATWAGVTRGRSMLGRSVATKLAVATLTPLALVVAWLVLALAELPALDDVPDARVHLHCALMSVAYAIGPLVAFFAVRRGTDPVHPRWGGAAIGAVAGTWGAVLYVASCGCTSPTHIALSHVLPIAMLAVSGALAGDRVLGLHSAGLQPGA
jgi:hypothetical protein